VARGGRWALHGLGALRADGPAAAISQLGAVPPAVRDQLAATPGRVLADCYAGMYTEPGAFGLRRHPERYLARRRCPVLAVHDVPEAVRWEGGLPGHLFSRTVLWPGAGHFLHWRRPGAFARLVERWVAGLP
jgi:pimeloyl-ACP methyl ester carboxylesterase